RATRVDFRFGEVGVDGERRKRVGTEPLRRVQTDVGVAFGVRVRRWPSRAGGERRSDAQSLPEIEDRQADEQPGSTDVGDLIVALRARPSVGLLQVLDATLDVEPPLGQPPPKEKALER